VAQNNTSLSACQSGELDEPDEGLHQVKSCCGVNVTGARKRISNEG
jgi:hypothetical protein